MRFTRRSSLRRARPSLDVGPGEGPRGLEPLEGLPAQRGPGRSRVKHLYLGDDHEVLAVTYLSKHLARQLGTGHSRSGEVGRRARCRVGQ